MGPTRLWLENKYGPLGMLQFLLYFLIKCMNRWTQKSTNLLHILICLLLPLNQAWTATSGSTCKVWLLLRGYEGSIDTQYNTYTVQGNNTNGWLPKLTKCNQSNTAPQIGMPNSKVSMRLSHMYAQLWSIWVFPICMPALKLKKTHELH